MVTFNKQLVQKYHREIALRKELHNQMIELKGNIRVLCRVRPPIAEDGNGENSKIVVVPDKHDDGVVNVFYKNGTKSYKVDKVFGECSTQEQVNLVTVHLSMQCKLQLHALFTGYNDSIFGI